jgi:hypothetical protein
LIDTEECHGERGVQLMFYVFSTMSD